VADRQRNFPTANAHAKRLRREPTPAEDRLWKLLRKIDGFHFRKQTPVGPYVFDFGDFGRRLLIELDGGIHDLPAVQERDRLKSAWAEGQGFVVLRIPNSYVFGTGEPAVALVLQAARSIQSD
jgi:very-short-patch-repair endonuclease